MLTGVLAFLVFLFALLAIPVTLTFQVSWRQAFQNDVKLEWGFGPVCVRFPSLQSKALSAEADESRTKTVRFERASRNKPNVLAAVRRKSFRRRIIRFVRDLWYAVHKKNVGLRVRIGLGDPADTGQLWAIVGPIAGILASSREASIRIEPEFFDAAAVELDSSGSIRIIPLRVIYLTVVLLLSPAVWQGIRRMRVAA